MPLASSEFGVRSRNSESEIAISDQLAHLSLSSHYRRKANRSTRVFSALPGLRLNEPSRSANASPETSGFALAAAIDQVVVPRASRFFDDVVIVLRCCVQVLQALLIACLQ